LQDVQLAARGAGLRERAMGVGGAAHRAALIAAFGSRGRLDERRLTSGAPGRQASEGHAHEEGQQVAE